MTQEIGNDADCELGNSAKPGKVDKMHAHEFRARLTRLNLSLNSFADFTGTNPRTVLRWDEGVQDIPRWVAPFLNLLAVACPPNKYHAQARRRCHLSAVMTVGASFYE